jgi:hypothetical protein
MPQMQQNLILRLLSSALPKEHRRYPASCEPACTAKNFRRREKEKGEYEGRWTHIIGGTRCEFKFNSDVIRESPGRERWPGSHGVEVTNTVCHVQPAVAAAGEVSALHEDLKKSVILHDECT